MVRVVPHSVILHRIFCAKVYFSAYDIHVGLGSSSIYSEVAACFAYLCCVSSSFFPSLLLSSPIFFSLSFQVVTQIRGHTAGSSPRFPLRYVPSFLSRKDFSLFFPCRLASNCAYPRGKALSTIESFYIFIFANKVKVRPTWGSNPGLKHK